jgi:hypothetical protein
VTSSLTSARASRRTTRSTARFAAVPDRVTVFGTNATVLTPLVSASDATDVDPDPAAPLLMTDTVRLFVFAPVIADGVTYCTDVTVAGNGATNTGVSASAPPLTAAATTCLELV